MEGTQVATSQLSRLLVEYTPQLVSDENRPISEDELNRLCTIRAKMERRPKGPHPINEIRELFQILGKVGGVLKPRRLRNNISSNVICIDEIGKGGPD